MTQPMTQPISDACKHCDLEIHRGVWFDTHGIAHEGVWSHLGGGLLCKGGGVATPRSRRRHKEVSP